MQCCETACVPEAAEGTSENTRVARWIRIAVSGLIAVNTMAVGLSVNLSAMAPTDRATLETILFVATLVVASLLAPPLFRHAWERLREGQMSAELLFIAGIAGALGASIMTMVTGAGDIYFEVASILLVVYAIGDEVSAMSKRRGMRIARDWLDLSPVCRIRTCCGHERELPIEEVEAGQLVVVHPGEAIPIDGEVVEGESLLSEEHVTGEAAPAVKRPGDDVFAGGHVVDSTLVIRTTKAAGQRMVDQIVASVDRAWNRPSRWQREADRVVKWFFPVVAVATLTTFAGWSWFDGWETGLLNSLAVLLVACPCALGFAVPLAVWQSLGRMASRGLVAGGGDVVERLAGVDTVVFDKTGTLTRTSDRILDVVTPESSPWSRRSVLAMATAVENTSRHPLARAFRSNATGSWVVESTRLIPARGIEGTVRNDAGERYTVQIGTPELTAATGELEMLRRVIRSDAGAHELVVIIDGRLAALAAIDETPHHAVEETRARLAALGLSSILSTGDRDERARRLGFEEVHARQTPEDKRAHVERLRAEGRRVLFVGDGVNDAAAMAEADVGISASSGAALATDVADLTWHGRDPLAIADAIERARDGVTVIRGNLAWAAVYNLLGVSVAAAGFLHPVLAAVLMVGSSLFVTIRTSTRLAPEVDN
jgi:Cu2+-exporting ATPase/Cu+-exporting ATPase